MQAVCLSINSAIDLERLTILVVAEVVVRDRVLAEEAEVVVRDRVSAAEVADNRHSNQVAAEVAPYVLDVRNLLDDVVRSPAGAVVVDAFLDTLNRSSRLNQALTLVRSSSAQSLMRCTLPQQPSLLKFSLCSLPQRDDLSRFVYKEDYQQAADYFVWHF